MVRVASLLTAGVFAFTASVDAAAGVGAEGSLHQQHLSVPNEAVALAAAPAPAGAVPAPGGPIPGTPALRGMPLNAAEQGFEGGKVQHVNQTTVTGDWGMEYGSGLTKDEHKDKSHEDEPAAVKKRTEAHPEEPTPPKSAGTRAVSTGLSCVAVLLSMRM